MDLSSLKPAKGAVKNSKKRLGRGEGSGRGGTSSKGHKGAQARTGFSSKSGFEGGQMPMQRRLPKFGFTNINRVEYVAVNLGAIQKLVDKYKITQFDHDVFVKHGMVSKKELVKILGNGELNSVVDIKANAFSATAKAAIEEKGGKTSTI